MPKNVISQTIQVFDFFNHGNHSLLDRLILVLSKQNSRVREFMYAVFECMQLPKLLLEKIYGI